jgi:hypothetical protein
MSGTRVGNIRIVEKCDSNGVEVLGVYRAFYEFDRLGAWAGKLYEKNVEELIEYLQNWLKGERFVMGKGTESRNCLLCVLQTTDKDGVPCCKYWKPVSKYRCCNNFE